MARQQKSLLEAFQKANDERAGGDPASAGPFAGTPTADLRTAEPRNLLPRFSARDSRVLLALAGWSLLIFVFGVLAGRYFVPDTSHAAEPATIEGETLLAAEGEWLGATLAPGDEVLAALDDPDNRYTVLAFSCGDSEAEIQSVWDHYNTLGDLRLPVALPVEYDGQIYLMVGAAPDADDLSALEQHLHRLTGAGATEFPYAEAFVLPIGSILDRGN